MACKRLLVLLAGRARCAPPIAHACRRAEIAAVVHYIVARATDHDCARVVGLTELAGTLARLTVDAAGRHARQTADTAGRLARSRAGHTACRPRLLLCLAFIIIVVVVVVVVLLRVLLLLCFLLRIVVLLLDSFL
eukprot:993933-Prymnesium_polylepis.3